MKKLMILGALALFSVSPAMAEEAISADAEVKKERKHDGNGRFAKADKNGDGMISKSEFLAQAKERFKTIDANNDGEISKDEAKAHRKNKMAKIKQRRANKDG